MAPPAHWPCPAWRGARTAAPTYFPIVPETPAGVQYGGRYIGCLECADQAGNIFFTKGYPGVVRFKVERSGTLNAFRWAMRYQTGAPGENQGYSRGTGGQVRVELRKVAGDTMESTIPDLAPSALLAETQVNNGQAVQLVGSGGNPVWSFTQGVRVTRGDTLCLLFHQHHDTDWISINGGWQEAPPAFGADPGVNGPYWGDVAAGMKGDTVHRWGTRWYYRKVTNPFLNLHYSDGAVTGTGSGYSELSSAKNVGGTAMVRQRFLVQGSNRTCDGIWLRAWNEGGAASAPLVVTIEQEGGGLVLRKLLSHTSFPATQAGTDPIQWKFLKFQSPISLLKDQTYQVRLSSAAPGYRINAAQDYGKLGYSSANRWTSSIADFTTNNGGTWYGWTIQAWNPTQYRKDMWMHMALRVMA